jgi:hypothetical protein
MVPVGAAYHIHAVTKHLGGGVKNDQQAVRFLASEISKKSSIWRTQTIPLVGVGKIALCYTSGVKILELSFRGRI